MTDLMIGVNSTAVTTGRIKLTSNGDNAKTAKVNILANSGGICYPWINGVKTPVVFDFAGMRHRASIPLDYDHEQTIGALNRFSIVNGQLSCGGWIDLVDIAGVPVNAMVAQMLNGTPYEASIEAWPDGELSVEYIPEGVIATVNSQQIVGPTFVYREWTLKAVAILKFGADYAMTNVSIAASAKEKAKKEKGYVIRLSKSKNRNTAMNKDNDDNKVEDVAAVEAAPAEVNVEDVTVEAEAVEAPNATESPVESAEVVETIAPEVEDDVEAEAPVAVEAPAPSEPQEVKSSASVEAKDSRAEYKAFKAKFNDKAGEYFEAGYSLAEASDKHMAYLSSALANAEQRLSAIGSGGKEPIKFSDGNARDFKAKANPIRLAGKRYDD